MRNLMRSAVATAFFVLLAYTTAEEGTARTARDGDGGPSGGGTGGRWYSMGSVTEVRYCQSYEQTIVFWPPPPHYELKMVTVMKETYYLLEACYQDMATRECTPGTQRKTYQGGGC
jgi:hypothetical protein